MAITNPYPHLNKSMMSYETLINAIEQLEEKGIISFSEFEKLAFHEKRKQYFSFPNLTMMDKAIIKIRDKRDGKVGPSENYCY